MLLTLAKQPAIHLGQFLAGAKLWLYQANTSTTFVTYQDGDYNSEHEQPIEANDNGIFPAIHIRPDSATNYRQLLTTSADVEVWDVDDIQANPFGTNALPVDDGANDLGSSSLRWKDLWISEKIHFKNSSYKTDLYQSAITADRYALFPDADILFGGMIVNTQNANYTFVIGDWGKTIYHTEASLHTYTIPPHASVAYAIGCVIDVDNNSTAALAIAPGSGVTIVTPFGSGSFTLPPKSSCRLKKVDTNTWMGWFWNLQDTFTATLTGMDAATTQTVYIRQTGKKVTIHTGGSFFDGTSNSTSMTMTGLAVAYRPAFAQSHPVLLMDNGALCGGWGEIATSGTITFGKGFDFGAFTAASTKGLNTSFAFSYELA